MGFGGTSPIRILQGQPSAHGVGRDDVDVEQDFPTLLLYFCATKAVTPRQCTRAFLDVQLVAREVV